MGGGLVCMGGFKPPHRHNIIIYAYIFWAELFTFYFLTILSSDSYSRKYENCQI